MTYPSTGDEPETIEDEDSDMNVFAGLPEKLQPSNLPTHDNIEILIRRLDQEYEWSAFRELVRKALREAYELGRRSTA